jgi:hypothetical protein
MILRKPSFPSLLPLPSPCPDWARVSNTILIPLTASLPLPLPSAIHLASPRLDLIVTRENREQVKQIFHTLTRPITIDPIVAACYRSVHPCHRHYWLGPCRGLSWACGLRVSFRLTMGLIGREEVWVRLREIRSLVSPSPHVYWSWGGFFIFHFSFSIFYLGIGHCGDFGGRSRWLRARMRGTMSVLNGLF